MEAFYHRGSTFRPTTFFLLQRTGFLTIMRNESISTIAQVVFYNGCYYFCVSRSYEVIYGIVLPLGQRFQANHCISAVGGRLLSHCEELANINHCVGCFYNDLLLLLRVPGAYVVIYGGVLPQGQHVSANPCISALGGRLLNHCDELPNINHGIVSIGLSARLIYVYSRSQGLGEVLESFSRKRGAQKTTGAPPSRQRAGRVDCRIHFCTFPSSHIPPFERAVAYFEDI